MSHLVICEMLGLFVIKLTADEKYSFCKENLPQSIQKELSVKQKVFFSIFCFISKIYIKFLQKF